jgi:pectate lyase
MGGSDSIGGAASGGASQVVSTGGASTATSQPTGGSNSVTATGGAGNVGGTSTNGVGGAATGGTPGSGGTPGIGGASAAATGGKSATGGATSSVGTTATGGSSAKGGSNATGGAATGGKSSTGGTTTGTATGGKSSTGGAATGGAATGGSVNTSTGSPESKPSGYGQATTGCGSTSYQDAASMSAMQSLIDAYSGTGGLCIRYTGKFNFASITDPCTQHSLTAQTLEVKKKSNITIMGADGTGANFGIHIAASSSNIIIRNMTFGLLPGGGDSDAISIEGMSGGVPTNIWIDHNELYSSMVECAGAGDTSFDGLIDLKKGADNVTVSYNYIHDHHKVSLNGYTDDDDVVRHITYHHNIFENVGSRTPLQRHGYSHVLNNYFNKVTTSGANIRMGGYSLIESNYFENCKNPVTSRDSTALGYWDLRNNNIKSPSDFTTYSITWTASDSTPTKDATDWTTTAAYPVALGYSYTADAPACLKSGLRNAAGAGKGLATLKCN